MTSHYYYTTVPGVKAGIDGVTKGTSTGSTNIELRVDDGTTGNSKEDVVKALEAFANFIITDSAPA